jgi:amino-acid N-acetyltransferase
MGSSRPEPQAALQGDLQRVVALLEAAGLPTAGVADHFPGGYAVVRAGAEVVAAAGLEIYAGVGLLRSVVVSEACRGRGLAGLLVENRVSAARAASLDALYLLTTTAAEYFKRHQFSDAARSQVPAELRASPEFASLCPASAVCLKRELAEPRGEPEAT